MPENNQYIDNVYNALKSKVQGFNVSPEEFKTKLSSSYKILPKS